MPSEPAWSKNISSSTVCTWFYALALLNLAFGVAGVLSALFLMSKGKADAVYMISIMLGASIGFINTWFLFLVCNRGLKA
jgi:hypothetical protein